MAEESLAVPDPPSLESWIVELATSLIDLAVEEIDDALESALRRIGERLAFDRCHLFERASDGRCFEIHQSYTKPGVPPTPIKRIGPDWPLVYDRIVSGELFAVDRLPAGLPAGAEAERRYVEEQGLRSGIALPLTIGGEIVGLIAFSSTRPRPLPETLVDDLKTVAKIFGNALARRRTERALRNSEARYRSLVENAPEAIGVIDADENRFVEVNANALRIFGWPREKLLDSSLQALSPPFQPDGSSSAEVLRQVERALAGEMPVFEWWHLRSDGVQFPCEVRLVRLPSARRRLVRGSLTDISERRQLEQQLRHSQKMDAVGQLAGGVAHDFNNLLTAITGHAELLLADVDLEEDDRRGLEEILHACDKAAGLTRQLLTFSRRQETAPEVLDVNTVIDGLARMLRRMIGAEIEMRVDLDPACGRVEVDPTQLEQVVLNLVINARDAMQGGGKLTLLTGAVKISGERAARLELEPGDYVMLEVADTGAGIPADVQSRVFEPFFTTKEQGKGTGLGLATVYGIVRRAGGAIWLESTLDAGTTFHVCLPVSDASPTAAVESNTTVVGGSETILLVEDERMVRQVASRSLSAAGYRVLQASDGRDALNVSRAHSGEIEIVVSDVVMPGIGGAELARRLAAERPDIKVLFVSGYAEERPDASASYRLLAKPYALARLAQTVREVLDAD